MVTEENKTIRRQMFDKMEQHLMEIRKPEDRVFYHHPSEDRIVLSHALFWVMTRNLKGSIAKEKFFLLLRQYQEEMLDAYLTESDYFPELLRYCNIIYDTLPTVLRTIPGKDARKLSAITIVACGYGGDMPESLCNELLDDMDFYYGRVKCTKIEKMLPVLNGLVRDEMEMLPVR